MKSVELEFNILNLHSAAFWNFLQTINSWVTFSCCSKVFLGFDGAFPPGRIAHTQRFPLVIPSSVWDLLVSRLGAFSCGRFPRPPPSLSVSRPVVSVSSAPEGHVHQALAAGSQLGVRAPAGRGGTGFREEAEEVEEESNGHLGISGSISHLEWTDGKKIREQEQY